MTVIIMLRPSGVELMCMQVVCLRPSEGRERERKKKKKKRLDFKPGEPGNSVVVTPLVDRGRGDSRNIIIQ